MQQGPGSRWFVFATAAALLVGVGLSIPGASPRHRFSGDEDEQLEGFVLRGPVSHRPTVEAAFTGESYRPGGTATLVLFDSARRTSVRLYRVGDAHGTLREPDMMRGTPVGHVLHLGHIESGRKIQIRLPISWPSALYYAELTASGGRIGYAPFVLAPRRLGQSRVAIVLPTQTWQAYNYRDDDGNGSSDTWYASPETVDTAALARPFENRGVPAHYRYYDEPFLRWLARNRFRVDFLSDRELKLTTGDALARAYALVVFPGHHEYVTEHEYDVVTRFRDLGGNLMFLSANNFFYKITIVGNVMTRVGQWRKLGRAEAALVGPEYFGWDSDAHGSAPWTIRKSRAGSWIFRGTGLRPGAPLSNGGIEADETVDESPPGIQVLAEIENAFDSGHNAQMTYYRAPSGAQVFAAGAFSLACSVWQPPVRQMLANLMERLSRPNGNVAVVGSPKV
jgi:hypothetical protein